jgi:hypothetical protein
MALLRFYSNHNCFSDAGFNPNPSVASQIAPLPATIPRPGSGGRGGNIDLFAKDFKLPQVFKASIAVDQNCR